MARSTDEIQAEIAVTRNVIESRLDALERRAPRPLWIVLGLLGAGALVGVVLVRLPVLRLLGASARTVQAGIGVATAVGALRRALTDGRRPRRARDVKPAAHLRNRLRRAA
jgi:hypothetical protein